MASSTHFAVIDGTTVVATRTSKSRHVDGVGKFGPYTHAVVSADGNFGTYGYCGSLARAQAEARTWSARVGHALRILPVVITPKRLKAGDQVAL
jgi:hypothetical protein